ncbi:unnamed protein product [Penicillium roqueforti FM164]|uniref:Uncharacterized protein n=1 Tax=Penicillium roqueforti (strain FM164) TaxID=1365484 RepID=W6R4E0_PENRF|nr:unnamed protein product [Penicillium roqueforti FM164]
MADYVPGGYINYVVWTRVAGEPINSVPYWKRDLEYREEVRSVFRATYKWLRQPTNIDNGELMLSGHISGFRDPDNLDPTPLSDVTYAILRLVRSAHRVDWMRDSSDWKC